MKYIMLLLLGLCLSLRDKLGKETSKAVTEVCAGGPVYEFICLELPRAIIHVCLMFLHDWKKPDSCVYCHWWPWFQIAEDN